MPILPRFFLVTSDSGVTSMSINIEGAKERTIHPSVPIGSNVCVLDCQNAVWTYNYKCGYIVTLRGPLSFIVSLQPAVPPQQQQQLNGIGGIGGGGVGGVGGGGGGLAPGQPAYSYKFENITFNSRMHDKAIRVEKIVGQRGEPIPRKSPKMKHEDGSTTTMSSSGSSSALNGAGTGTGAGAGSAGHDDDETCNVQIIERAEIPQEPINTFGIPQATMRCLEVRVFEFLVLGLCGGAGAGGGFFFFFYHTPAPRAPRPLGSLSLFEDLKI